MDQVQEQASVQGVPCGLHHHLFYTGKDPLAGVSKDECTLAFRFWVEKLRIDTSGLSTREHAMCPMLWCERTFEDQVSATNQMPPCQWLPDTWYPCPCCSRHLHRKGSKLQKAVAFFKHFGRKTSIKKIISWPTSSGNNRELADTSQPRPAEIEGDAESSEKDYLAAKSELWSPLSCTAHGYWSDQNSEASIDPKSPLEMPSRLSHAVQHELLGSPGPNDKAELLGDSIHYKELCGDLLQGMDVDTLEARPKSSATVAISPVIWPSTNDFAPQPFNLEPTAEASQVFPHERFPIQSLNCIDSVISPSSPSRDALHIPTPTHFVTGHTHSDYMVPETTNPDLDVDCSRLEARSLSTPYRANMNPSDRLAKVKPICYFSKNRRQLWDAILSTTHKMDWEPSTTITEKKAYGEIGASYLSRDDEPLSGADLQSMEPLIYELHEIVSIVNEELLARLASHPDLLIRCSTPPSRKLFELGISVLHKFYRGTFVGTFEDVFALMHIAYASAYLLHRDDESYCWDDLSQEILDWQHAIFDQTESLLFVRIMDKLSNPRGSMMILSDNDHFPLIGDFGGGLQETPRTGQVMKDCATLLYHLDCSRILDRNDRLLPAHLASYADIYGTNIEQMIAWITGPLQRQQGMEFFQEIVIDTEFRLRSGMLRSPWEVEVHLLCPRGHSRSPQLYQRYQESVQSLCDGAMEGSDPGWRDPYYATTLDLALAQSLEMHKRRGDRKTHSPLIEPSLSPSVLDVVRPSHVARDPLTVTTSIETNVGANPSPISTASASSMESSATSDRDSTLTSPTAYTDSRSSAASSPSSPFQKQEIRCHLCSRVFTGTSRLTNLQRHLRTARIHNNVASFECPQVGCGAKFRRSDNMNQHFQAMHQLC